MARADTHARVVLIEDDPGLTHLLTDVLTMSGYTVDARDSAFGAAALVRTVHATAVVLDLGLPYRTGTSLLDELKGDPAMRPSRSRSFLGSQRCLPRSDASGRAPSSVSPFK